MVKFTYHSILTQLHEEFPEVDKDRIDRIVRYGLNKLRILLKLDIIVRLASIRGTLIFFNPDAKQLTMRIAKRKEKVLKTYRKHHQMVIENYYRLRNGEEDS